MIVSIGISIFDKWRGALDDREFLDYYPCTTPVRRVMLGMLVISKIY